MNESFELHAPDHFAAGAIGPPGQRVFYLQAREGAVLVTLKAEKEQIGALAEYLAGLLARLPVTGGGAAPDASLVEPIAPAWAVRSLGVGYDEDGDRVIIVAEELVEAEDADGDEADGEETESEAGEEEEEEAAAHEVEGASARFHVSRRQAAAFVEQARSLVKAGRPSCPVCGRPMNATGHVCPRSNGHGRD
jgi:uncharacterized repeat protein (TIGR03847 family)